jgi:hypothetical protein
MTKLKLAGKSNILKKSKSKINKRELSLAMAEATKCGSGFNTLKGYVSLPNFNSNSEENYGFYISGGEIVVDSISNIESQINSNCLGVLSQPTQPLRLTFDNITNANLLVGDASNVADWNTFFDLPTYGNPFTSVVIVGNEVQLFGGSDIGVKPALMTENNNIISVVDDNSIIYVGGDAFSYCYNLTTVYLPLCTGVGGYEESPDQNTGGFGSCTSLTNLYIPNLITAGELAFESIGATEIYFEFLTTIASSAFFNCQALTSIDLPALTTVGNNCFSLDVWAVPSSLTTINLPSCTNLGSTVGDNTVFYNTSGKTITLTVPAALMTNNGGNPDGDIQYLQANNTVTIVTV